MLSFFLFILGGSRETIHAIIMETNEIIKKEKYWLNGKPIAPSFPFTFFMFVSDHEYRVPNVVGASALKH